MNYKRSADGITGFGGRGTLSKAFRERSGAPGAPPGTYVDGPYMRAFSLYR